MAQPPFAIVGFDLDGTLLDTTGDLTAAVNHALERAGRAMLDETKVAGMIGGGAKHMLAQAMAATGGCTDAAFRPIYKAMLAYYGDHLAVHTRPFPGAVAAIDRLREQGVKLAVVTNKFESFAARLLRDLQLADRFDTIIGGDTLGPGKAKPDRAPIDAMIARLGGGRAAFVGDSIYDVEAAHNAGVPAIAVSFGSPLHPTETLGADAVIDHWDGLDRALEQLA